MKAVFRACSRHHAHQRRQTTEKKAVDSIMSGDRSHGICIQMPGIFIMERTYIYSVYVYIYRWVFFLVKFEKKKSHHSVL